MMFKGLVLRLRNWIIIPRKTLSTLSAEPTGIQRIARATKPFSVMKDVREKRKGEIT